ncbi:MAG TPA: YncE family protein [Armatimonadota bacterium]|jgi:YVTN family beta-propeller protein
MRKCRWALVACAFAALWGTRSESAEPSYHQVAKLQIGGDGGWDYLNLDPETHRLYIARSNRVTVVDVDKGSVVGEVPNTPGVHGVALVPKLKRGFASSGADNAVVVFDLGTLKETGRVTVGSRPDAILFDSATNRVFTMNGGSQDVTAVDPKSLKVVGTVPVGGRPEFAVSDGRGHVWVNIEDKGEVVELDPRALKVTNRWPLAPGEGPSGLALDTRGRRLFSVCDNGKMTVLNADTGKLVATPAIGQGPDACVFDGSLGLAFSSNGRDGTLTVVKQETPDRYRDLATVPTQAGARTMTLDPKTHRIYLATASFAPQTSGGAGPQRRPAVLPNSFVILVYGP